MQCIRSLYKTDKVLAANIVALADNFVLVAQQLQMFIIHLVNPA